MASAGAGLTVIQSPGPFYMAQGYRSEHVTRLLPCKTKFSLTITSIHKPVDISLEIRLQVLVTTCSPIQK